jgi:hypothetical protein
MTGAESFSFVQAFNRPRSLVLPAPFLPARRTTRPRRSILMAFKPKAGSSGMSIYVICIVRWSPSGNFGRTNYLHDVAYHWITLTITFGLAGIELESEEKENVTIVVQKSRRCFYMNHRSPKLTK